MTKSATWSLPPWVTEAESQTTVLVASQPEPACQADL